MTAFHYRALDPDGRTTSGVVEADHPRGARQQLRARGLQPVEVAKLEAGQAARRRARLSRGGLVLYTRQLATLLASDLTVEQALAALAEQTDSPRHRELFAEVRSDILAGYSLRAALDRHAADFPDIYRASVAAGERSGSLAAVMNLLGDYLERSAALRQKTLNAMIYPALVAGVGLLVVIGLMTQVVPQVVAVFHQSRQELPTLTRLVMGTSRFLVDWGWLLLAGFAAAGLGAAFAGRHEAVRHAWHRRLLALPLLGKHLRAVDTERLASTLAILTGSGVPILAALNAGRQVVSLLPLAEAVRRASDGVRDGAPLSRALQASQAFPPILIHMIASGEATGRLGDMLARAAAIQQREVETRTAVVTSLLEPLMLLLMGGLVLVIVLAVMQPIIEINTLLK